jgi:1,4-alpha-glucan branching enzyme
MQGPAYLALVLHAHLPFVRHPEHEIFVEEDWFFEALTETYLPLLRVFERLERDRIDYKLTLSLSCTLVAMLDDALLRRRYDRYLEDVRRLLERERRRAQAHAALRPLVEFYEQRLVAVSETWQTLGGDVVAPLLRLQEAGVLELITSSATHAYLPLIQQQPAAAAAQIRVAVEQHHRRMGCAPWGMWLPECGYVADIDQMLAAAGVRYFIGDSHALLFARPRPRYGCHAPAFCADSGVAVFGRDPESAEQVWSRDCGYPGHRLYRDFYRDLGYDLPAHELGSFALPAGLRRHTGLKYYRVTGPGNDKELYEPSTAEALAREHAHDFVTKRVAQLSRLLTVMPQPVVVAPYDAELFGHWWFEGCIWLEHVLRDMASQPAGAPRLTHLSGYLQQHETLQAVRPAASSWGAGGFHQYWLDGTNAWVYPRLHRAAERMSALARSYATPTELQRRALNQAARSLLLAQASDWPFIMRSNTVVSYARRRIEQHLTTVEQLTSELARGDVSVAALEQAEADTVIFPDLDYRVYA